MHPPHPFLSPEGSGSPAQGPSESTLNARRCPRLKIPAMYSLVRVRPAGTDRYLWTGHIYDVSLSGMRFELDQPLDPGTPVEVRGILPGQEHVTFRAAGRVVRLHDDASDLGPARMGMHFDQFLSEVDQARLTGYLDDHGLKIAA
ncbi:MAG: PilZ domain-containing protein [Planctomycetota bacterium]